MIKTKYALVLGGGGAKGAYDIGVWKALKELKIQLSAVIGNSVGALNSALIVQNDLKKAIDIWENLTIDKIVSIPSKLLNKKGLYLDRKNILEIRKLQEKLFFHNIRGLNTEPLKKLILENLDEEKIRKSKIDFGIAVFQLNKLKLNELFIKDIQKGLLADYLLASASVPFIFKRTKIRGVSFIDGGIYENIPYTMAKKRGYQNIIIVDASGPGINRKPDVSNTKTIYIKNSISFGKFGVSNFLTFSSKIIRDFMKLGYLDTLRIFGKIYGIKYFYNFNIRIVKILEDVLFNIDTFNEYKKYLKSTDIIFNKDNVEKEIRRILPKEMKNHLYIIISLAECAALSINIERNNLYNFNDFLQIIWNKYNKIEKEFSINTDKENKNFFEILAMEIKRFHFNKNIENFFKHDSYEYEKILRIIFGEKNPRLHIKALENLFSNLIPAKIFFIILKKYFNFK